MKIAMLSPFYPYRGGIAQFSAMLYTALEKEGHEVKAFNFKRLYPNFLFPGKTQYVEEGDAIVIPGERLLDSVNPFSYCRTEKAIRAFRPDVLIIAYWMSFFVPGYAHIANRMKRHCKVITLIHNAIPHEPRFFDRPLASLFFRQSSAFVVMSQTVKDDLLKLIPQAQYIYNPHPLYHHFGEKRGKEESCRKLSLPAGKRTLLFFGLIRDYKGVDLLIRAMDGLDDNYQLIIAGESYGSFDKYRALIDSSPACARIHVYNRYIGDEEIPFFFSAADALVLPYRSATQSGVVSIACNYDLPMVATPVGDFPQSIGLPQTGIVVPEISPKAIANGVTGLFEPENLSFFRANIAKEKAALSWDVLAKALIEFSDTL
ncbi:MAG: glycosyltransferase [Tannerellaceae bacterium]|jgi:glycosyltransferase involved in cell wall biosynthesis|nr:glycosyltransferase [Tannerellaceae bacterium]